MLPRLRPVLPPLGAWLLLCACALLGGNPAQAMYWLEDAVDQTRFAVNTSEDAPWFSQNETAHDGVDAARSHPVEDNGASTLSVTVEGSATVGFFWKVSSESCCDTLRFSLDGVEQFSIRGDVDWRKVVFQIASPGPHTLAWTYTKDGSDSSGEDAAWLDELTIEGGPQTSPYFREEPKSAFVLAGDSATLRVDAGGNQLSFQWYQGTSGDTSQPIPGATGRLLLTPPLSAAASFWVRVGNDRGSVDSTTANVAVAPRPGRDLYGMGSSVHGELGVGISRSDPTQMLSSGVSEVAAGVAHSLFLKTDGTLWALGQNSVGQLGDGSGQNRSAPVQIATNVAHIAAGSLHSLFVKTDGSLWAMGHNSGDQLGDGSYQDRLAPVQVASDVAQIAAGGGHSLFIKTDGTLWGMGANYYGQLGDGSLNGRPTPVQIASDVVQVSAGAAHNLFVKTDGSLWGMGENFQQQLSYRLYSGPYYHQTPIQIATGVASAAAGQGHSLFIKTDGSLWGMGDNDYSQLGNNSFTDQGTPVQVASDVAFAEAGGRHSLFVKTDGSLWAMGDDFERQLGDGSSRFFRHSTPIRVASDVTKIAAGYQSSLFIKSDGSLWAMGNNDYDQLSEALDATQNAPILIDTDVIQVETGTSHSLILKADGTLRTTGNNDRGQLGDGSYQDRSRPVPAATDAAPQLAAGDGHSLFLKADGSLWAMGENSYGQLGPDGPYRYNDHRSPGQIESGVARIAAGKSFTLFLKTDASLWSMGDNYYGQLGNGISYPTARGLPSQIASDVVQIAAGDEHGLFLKADGTLWAMGRNLYGQFGDDRYPAATTPIQVASDVTRISAGAFHSLFLKTDGSLWATGRNNQGQLGDGSAGDRNIPVQIATEVVQISAGEAHSLFLKADGSLWATGSNASGQLGDGTYATRYTPVQVAAGVVSIAAGGQHSLFLKGPVATHTVTFELGAGGTRIGGGDLVQTVAEGTAARPPEVAAVSSDATFSGWDTDFDRIVADCVVHAIYRRPQTVSFVGPAPQVFDPASSNPVPLSATASSGLPVIFEVVSGPAVLDEDGQALTLTEAGTVVLRALQPGNTTWAAAPSVEQSLVVVTDTDKGQKIIFAPLSARTYGDPAFPLEASASSGLPVTFEVLSGPATLAGDSLTVTDVGLVVIKASQSGGDGFGAAAPVVQSFAVNKAQLTVTANNTARLVGKPNPELTLTYSGFVGPDAGNEGAAIAALDQPPVAHTAAVRQSPAGEYAITLSGGSDDRYEFVFADPAGIFTILEFGGTYEALLFDPEKNFPLVGKLRLTIPTKGLSYTGTLTLAREAKPLAVASTARSEGTTPLLLDPESASASATWNRVVATGSDSLVLSVNADGMLTGSYYRNHELRGILLDGRRLYVPTSRDGSPWSGRHTLILGPGYDSQTGVPVLQMGFGHAAVSISSTSGVLSLSGKLADGRPLTASTKPTEIGTYLLWTNPYGSRTHSFLAGLMEDEFFDTGAYVEATGEDAADDSNGSRSTHHTLSGSNPLLLVWQKAALPASTPPAKRDKSHRDGFSLLLSASFDRWFPPVKKATASQPVLTLPQRLGLASTNVAFGEIAVSYPILDEIGYPLPDVASLSSAGKLLVGTPNPTNWKITALNPATGAFSGRFTLTDPTPTDRDPDKVTRRSVSFSGTLRQNEDESLVGCGFFLLPPLPGAESDETVSGEIRFTRP